MNRRFPSYFADLAAGDAESRAGSGLTEASRRRPSVAARGRWASRLGKIFINAVEQVLPASAYVLAMSLIEEAQSAVAKRDFRSAGDFQKLHFHVVQSGVGHKHLPAQFQQHRSLNHLYVAP